MADQDVIMSGKLVREISVDDLLGHIQWSQESLPLSKFVEQYRLPQIVKVEEGYYGAHDESSLSAGQILKVHYTRISKRVRALDRVGNEVHIPLHTLHRVMLKPRNYKVVYQTVADVAHANPLPRYVEITQGYYNVDSSDSQELSIEPGEKLEVGAVELLNIRGHHRKYMTFTSFNGVEVKLPFNCMAGFKPLDDIEDHTLSDIIKTNNLPIFVQFVLDQSGYLSEVDKSNALMRLGVLKLEKVYSEELIIASCGHNGSHVVFTIPKSLSVTVKIAAGTLKVDPLYSEICTAYNDFSDLETKVIESHETDLFSGPGGLKEYEYEHVVPPRGVLLQQQLPGTLTPNQFQGNNNSSHFNANWGKLIRSDRVEDGPCTLITLPDDSGGGKGYEADTATQSSMGSTETFDSRSSTVDIDPYSSKGEADDELEYDYSKFTLALRGASPVAPVKASVADYVNTSSVDLKETSLVIGNVDGDNAESIPGNSEEKLDTPTPVVTVTPMVPTYGSQIVIEEAEVVQNPLCSHADMAVAKKTSVEARQSDSASDTDDSFKNKGHGSLWDSLGPIDPGNVSSTSDSYIYSARAKHVERASRLGEAKYRSMSFGPQNTNLIFVDEQRGTSHEKGRSHSNPIITETAPHNKKFNFSSDLGSLDIDEVCQSLHSLNLGHLEETFRHNQINGSLLICLDDDSLKDLKLSSFERRKVLNFIQGWRPDK